MMCQSSLSRLITALERDLGFMLFSRNKHRVLLTGAGGSLLPVTLPPAVPRL